MTVHRGASPRKDHPRSSSVSASAAKADRVTPDDGQSVGLESSVVRSMRYVRRQRLLEITYRNGNRYCYHDVPPAVVRAFLAASSKGAFLNAAIKPHFAVTGPTTRDD